MLNDTFSVIFKHRVKLVNALIIFTFILFKEEVSLRKDKGGSFWFMVSFSWNNTITTYEDLIDTDDVIYLGWHSSPTAWPPDDFSRKKGLRFGLCRGGLKSRLATAEPFCKNRQFTRKSVFSIWWFLTPNRILLLLTSQRVKITHVVSFYKIQFLPFSDTFSVPLV